MTLSREEVERALIPAVKRGGLVSLTAGTVTGLRHVDGQIVDGPTGPVGQEGYVLNVDGHRYWLPFDGASPSHLAAIAALTSRVAALESPGPWVTCTLSGVTGNAIVRKLSNNLAEITASVAGTFAEGNTSNIITLPVGYRPVNPTGTSHVRLPGYFNGGYVATVWVEPGGAVGVTQRSGGTRSDLAFRGVFGLN